MEKNAILQEKKLVRNNYFLDLNIPKLILKNSPNKNYGGRIKDNFQKINHNSQMYSLANAFSKNDIKEFILITSNYHMPRAILEFKNVMPNLKIYTYAITPKKHDIENWLSSFQTFSLVFTEYCKFIIAGLRIKFFST